MPDTFGRHTIESYQIKQYFVTKNIQKPTGLAISLSNGQALMTCLQKVI
jgi:hypothetical protein